MQVDEVDRAIWLQAMEPVYQNFESEIGPNIIVEIQKEIAKLPEERQ
jgi:hypothetical protein